MAAQTWIFRVNGVDFKPLELESMKAEDKAGQGAGKEATQSAAPNETKKEVNQTATSQAQGARDKAPVKKPNPEAVKQAAMKAAKQAAEQAERVTTEDLARLVIIQNRAHEAETPQELAIFATNQSHELSPYFQSVFWHRNSLNAIQVMAVSGVSSIDSNAIIVRFMVKLIKAILDMEESEKSKILGIDDVSGQLKADWEEMMPPHCQWLPFTKDDRTEAGLLIFYEEPINRKQKTLFDPLTTTYSHLWYSMAENRKKTKGFLGRMTRSSITKWVIFFIIVAILAIPVRESALAPAQVVAIKPAIVGSTISGVIKQLHVQANDIVSRGDLLVSLDATEAVSSLEVAENELESAQTEYLIASQRAFNSEDAKAEVALLQSRAEAAKLKVQQAKNLLERTRIYAARDGIAIYTDEYEFLGQTVNIGQRIMLLADVNSVEMDISMPVGDTIDFRVGDKVSLFLNTDPTKPVKAILRQTSYEPRTEDSGEYVFLLKATFEDTEFKGRIGWAGTAKVYSSDRVTLFMYIFRRPIASARRFFGW